MIIPLLFNCQLRVYVSRLEKRIGVCSKVYQEKDKHILLWDFDEIGLDDVIASLYCLQETYDLPSIYIVSSSPFRYHAYSFTARTFREVIHILSATPEIDLEYLRLGMARGYYTLRISERKGEAFILLHTLLSLKPDEVSPLDVSVDEYFTMNKGGKKYE